MALEEVVTGEVVADHPRVLRELTRLLESQRFSSSPQMSAFLRYVVMQTLEGKGDRIKAYTIGVDALGKPDEFDAQNDPSVRVLALRLRKALNATYESSDLSHAIIELKPGSYMPEFKLPHTQNSNILRLAKEKVEDVTAEQSRDVLEPRLKTVNGGDVPYDITGSSEQSRAVAPVSQHKAVLASRGNAKLLNSALAVSVLFFLVYALSTKFSGAELPEALGDQAVIAGEPMPVRLLSMNTARQANAVDSPVVVSRNAPSVLLPTTHDQSDQVKQMSLLISASLVEFGAIDVVLTDRIPSSSVVNDNSYALIFNEMSVDSKPRIDMQLVRIDTGSVIMNETLVLDRQTTDFSAGEVKRIEKVAHSISDLTGPLSLDGCKTNGFSTAGDGCA